MYRGETKLTIFPGWSGRYFVGDDSEVGFCITIKKLGQTTLLEISEYVGGEAFVSFPISNEDYIYGIAEQLVAERDGRGNVAKHELIGWFGSTFYSTDGEPAFSIRFTRIFKKLKSGKPSSKIHILFELTNGYNNKNSKTFYKKTLTLDNIPTDNDIKCISEALMTKYIAKSTKRINGKRHKR